MGRAHGNNFRITRPLLRESTSHRGFPQKRRVSGAFKFPLLSSCWTTQTKSPISLQWRDINVSKSQITGISTVFHSVNSGDMSTDPFRKGVFQLECIYTWVVTEWSQYVCINQSPGDIKGMTEETPNARRFQLHQICRTNSIQVSRLHWCL